MTTYPNSPKLIKGGIVLLDPDTAQVKDVISLWAQLSQECGVLQS